MGKNHKKSMSNSDIAGLFLVGISVLMSLSLISFAQVNGNNTNNAAQSTILSVICQIFNTIKNVIFILGLTLMILGGALYAGANLMPSQSRGGFQGYGMAMIIGGVIGVAIAVAAPFILNLIIRTNPNAVTINVTSNSGNTNGATGNTSVCTNLQTANG